jgi:hypothetical protein
MMRYVGCDYLSAPADACPGALKRLEIARACDQTEADAARRPARLDPTEALELDDLIRQAHRSAGNRGAGRTNMRLVMGVSDHFSCSTTGASSPKAGAVATTRK